MGTISIVRLAADPANGAAPRNPCYVKLGWSNGGVFLQRLVAEVGLPHCSITKQ